MFETVSFHVIKPCNMKCKFCYATFQDFKVNKILSLKQSKEIVLKLKEAGMKKITFAGGEPMLYKHLDDLIIYSKTLGLTTSIITNGSFIDAKWLIKMKNHLDWIGISIDSLNPETNKLIGRNSKNIYLDYHHLLHMINFMNYRLKVNTVVNKYNQEEFLSSFIEYHNVERWKVFDTLKVEGQNDIQFEEIKSTDFNSFIRRNQHPSMVVEDNKLMTASYLLIDPLGRLFENSQGKHTYSDTLIGNTVENCLSQINLNRETFLERGGIYNW